MRFDTRDKKPKLYSLAVLSTFVLAVAAGLAASGIERNAAYIGVAFVLYFALVLVLLLRAYVGQLQYNPYSYNTIFYLGFALFVLAVLVMHGYITVQLFLHPETYTIHQILGTLLDSAKNYMLLSAPFVLLFSLALCVSNFSLIRHEGFRFVNILGILLSFLMVAGEAFLFRFDYYATGSQLEVMLHDLAANLFAAFYLYFECMIIGTIAADALVARYEPERDKDYIIILGCGIRKDGSPSPLLRGRIDRALSFAEKQVKETGKEPVFVTSGGQGANEVISESAAMKRYLLEKGIPERRILEEDRSTSTFENMKFSKEKILERGEPGKVAFSTTNYHVFRSGLFARLVKMRAQGMGAETRWYFWPNAAVREFVGLLTAHRLKQGLILGGMLLTYLVLTLLNYR